MGYSARRGFTNGKISGAARQAELEAALEEKTERWVYLNELKEQIDAQNG